MLVVRPLIIACWIAFALLTMPVVGAQQSPVAAIGASRILPPRLASAFHVKGGMLQQLDLPTVAPNSAGFRFSFSVVLAGQAVDVNLWQHELRAPGFQLHERSASGLVPVPNGPCTTYRGGIIGDINSRASASFSEGVLRAMIIRSDGLWIVQPMRDAAQAGPLNAYVVFRGGDCLSGGGHCGVPTLGSPLPSGLPDSVYECELGLEADHDLYLLNNSNTLATQAEVLGIVNAADLIFQSDVTVALQVSQLIVDVTPDPYTSANASLLLQEMRSYWNANYGGVGRDIAHLFSGRQVGASSSGVVGLAYTATACDVNNAYALSQTRWNPNYALRVALTAHELGHNLGATHCDLSSGCNIMCSGIGGCMGVSTSFGSMAQTEIQAYLQTVGCLTLVSSVPQITSATPVIVETVSPSIVTLGGSGFLGTTSMTIAGQPLVGTYTVLSDTALRFSPPAGLSLGVHAVTLTNPAGTSNATFLIYQGSDPCRIVAPIVALGGSQFTWRLGGSSNGVGYLGVSLVDTVAPFQGLPLLTEFLTLWVGPLDARGMGSFTVSFVPAALAGFPFYSQLVDSYAGTSTLRSTSMVLRTLIY